MMRIMVVLVVAGLLPLSAHAYLDPATGSILVQGLIGAIAAIGVFFGRIRGAVRRLLSGKNRKAEP
jgi:hypothetical protein